VNIRAPPQIGDQPKGLLGRPFRRYESFGRPIPDFAKALTRTMRAGGPRTQDAPSHFSLLTSHFSLLHFPSLRLCVSLSPKTEKDLMDQ